MTESVVFPQTPGKTHWRQIHTESEAKKCVHYKINETHLSTYIHTKTGSFLTSSYRSDTPPPTSSECVPLRHGSLFLWLFFITVLATYCYKSPQNLAGSDTEHIFSHSFWGTGIQKWLVWVVLTLSLSWGWAKVMVRAMVKQGSVVEDLLPSSFTWFLADCSSLLAFGQRPQFHVDLWVGCFELPQTWPLAEESAGRVQEKQPRQKHSVFKNLISEMM